MLDGSKALAAAVRRHAGEAALIQRCQVHKRRNVLDHLTDEQKPPVAKRLNAAYALEDYAAAKQALSDAGILESSSIDRTRCGVYLGSGEGIQDFHHMVSLVAMSYQPAENKIDTATFTREGYRVLHPGREYEQELHTTPGHIAEYFDLEGPNYNCLTACAASSQALGEARISPDDVDHVNAHAAGSVANDAWEARAIQSVFAGCKRPVPVFAPKSYFGNLSAGSDLSELAISLLALTHGQLPRTLNYEVPDPACPVRVNREPTPVSKPYVVKLGQAELGQCAAVVCRKWE